MDTVLSGKRAVVYGAGGAIGGAVAKAFAREGAAVFLTGPRAAALDRVAAEISAAGGTAATAVVDALDEAAVERHLDSVAQHARTIDISFNAVGFREAQGIPLVDLSLEDFTFPITSWSQTVFLTSRAAARRMTEQGSGVVLAITPPAAGTALASGFGAACATVESIIRTLAAEVGPAGVRALLLRLNAAPESPALQASFAQYASGAGVETEAALAALASTTMLRRLPTLAEIGNVAAFAASDWASAVTGSVIKIDCGTP
jgi:3-oxoacyl-[acyl-carrier protein] reductase